MTLIPRKRTLGKSTGAVFNHHSRFSIDYFAAAAAHFLLLFKTEN